MKFRKKSTVIEAEQWFPGKKVTGVQGDNPNMICGCVALRGAKASVPHVHTAHNNQAVDLEPGDWIVAEPDGRGYYPIKQDIFAANYIAINELTQRQRKVGDLVFCIFDGAIHKAKITKLDVEVSTFKKPMIEVGILCMDGTYHEGSHLLDDNDNMFDTVEEAVDGFGRMLIEKITFQVGEIVREATERLGPSISYLLTTNEKDPNNIEKA